MADVQHIVCELPNVDISICDVREEHGYVDSAKRLRLVTGVLPPHARRDERYFFRAFARFPAMRMRSAFSLMKPPASAWL